jgi:glycosyltransferase involved in cell wall biosynthesis
MRIAIITTDYFPLRSSGAVQLRDLVQEFIKQGHKPVVLVPAELQRKSWIVEILDGAEVLRIAVPRMKGVGNLRRALSEMWMPFAMLYGIWKSPLGFAEWDGIAWYSPSIFFGPLVAVLKRRSKCRCYLILRDIFPEWVLDLGLLRKGPTYYFFKSVARYQYALSDTIGVQTPSNLKYLHDWSKAPGRRLEVLQNWLALSPPGGSTIQIAKTHLAGRTIFVYIGNMGVAQGMDILIDLAASFNLRPDVGFLFVGRGTDVPRLRANAIDRRLNNIIFHDEVDPGEIPALLSQCHIGLLALDPRHRTHNIPGKFLTYVQAGLPVLARINPDTDLAKMIESEGVGCAYVGDVVSELHDLAEELADNRNKREVMSMQGRALSTRMFSPTTAVNQIVEALAGSN